MTMVSVCEMWKLLFVVMNKQKSYHQTLQFLLKSILAHCFGSMNHSFAVRAHRSHRPRLQPQQKGCSGKKPLIRPQYAKLAINW